MRDVALALDQTKHGAALGLSGATVENYKVVDALAICRLTALDKQHGGMCTDMPQATFCANWSRAG